MVTTGSAPVERRLETFQQARPRLLGIAYRMLGSRSEAEDIVQDAWLRFDRASPTDLRSPNAFLATIVVRLALDELRSARAKREQYIGTWLPEPIATAAESPEEIVATRESLSLAFLFLLERLTPMERAVFVLHESLGFRHPEIADMAGCSVAASRQHLSRARKHLRERRRFVATAEQQRAATGAFVRAVETGDTAALLELLTDDVVFYSDGGGKAPAAMNTIYGRDRVFRLLNGLRMRVDVDMITELEINGEAGVGFWLGGHLHTAGVLVTEGDRVVEMYWHRNPDKLASLAAPVALREPAVSP